MRIAFLSPTLELHGGTLVMLRYAEHLASRGHEATIISPASRVECQIPEGVRTVTYPGRAGRLPFLSYQMSYLSDVVERLRPDYDVVVPIYTPLAVHAVHARRRLRARFRVVLLFQDSFEMVWVGNYLRALLSCTPLAKRLDEVVAVSHGSARAFHRWSGVTPHVVLNGIEESYFSKGGARKSNHVLFVGRPGRSKGFDVFQKAMAIVKREAPGMEGLLVSSAVDDGAIGQIRTIHFKNRDHLSDLYARARLYVHASIAESFGLPPLEAMASGTATVLTKTVGTTEYARHGENCLETRRGDHRQLAKNALRLIQDEALRSRVERCGRVTAEKYRWPVSLNAFEKIVTRAVARPTLPGVNSGSTASLL